jgi:hypothetical protein
LFERTENSTFSRFYACQNSPAPYNAPPSTGQRRTGSEPVEVKKSLTK